MTKRMLIDTTHAEETRVVVLDGNRLDDYDVETSAKKQLKGNIYLAKIVRIEPSLQAAFVEYGGNRHGFLAFSEIHPDYYQIPVADRERLIALQEEEARAEEARADREDEENERAGRGNDDDAHAEREAGPDAGIDIGADTHPDVPANEAMLPATPDEPSSAAENDRGDDRPVTEMPLEIEAETVVAESDVVPAVDGEQFEDGEEQDGPAPETVSGESADDGHAQRRTARFLRQYKIQEVMRRRQIILVQVVKEERGNKGAALTTYISLAGRFSVLMPNSPRGGGVSRKITSAADRRRLKEITQELEIPRGMGMIVRTAGAQRPRAEIRRDGEYLLRTWDDIRETTLASVAPCLVYEEASLIKRAIRDVYTRDVEEIIVDGEAGWKSAREFMRMLMPAHANKVSLWRDGGQTLFGHYGVEHHLDAMLQPTVQLRSGGYLVINQTEALVAIDVNSGRSTRERGIEETAFRTNMEAADEVARQLRLRDLAGLIVIDFIDMEVRRNNAAVERRLKDALRNDRARIQVGSISHFGLLEMSRQRLRPSIAESSFVTCPHCAGTGFVRGTESSALHVLRAIEEEAGKRKASEILVHVAGAVALYVLNHKRAWLGEIEARYGLTVHLAADDSLLPPNLRIDRIRPYLPPAAPLQQVPAQHAPAQQSPAVTTVPIAASAPPSFDPFEQAETDESVGDPVRPAAPQADAHAGVGEGDENGRRRKRRRRRRGGRRENGPENGVENGIEAGGEQHEHDADQDEGEDDAGSAPIAAEQTADKPAESVTTERSDAGEGDTASRGRRRRGGRNRNRQHDAETGHEQAEHHAQAPRAYTGPTPADPFAGSFDIFEMMDRDADELEAASPAPAAQPVAVEPAPVAEAAPAPIAETAAEPVVPEAIETAEAAPVEADTAATETPVVEAKVRKPRVRKTAAATAKAKPVKAAAVAEPETAGEAETAAAPAKPKRKAPARARKTATPAVEATTETVSVSEAAPAETAVAAAEAAPVAADAATPPASEADPSIVQPRVIDGSAPPATRRTGWWKR
ncbi:Rne/Rng family ribonuclease [Acetobacteraceae bacterium KSS8]|uniref:Ribonuclease E n=1 Tax=Endosaccharibacter trunci TaxID=2812733 RepID=A0ABT1W712_9PROT|nr:Rne/Rng family ribonuclease [Acetobacteraceae bacterium KSS8]